MSVPDDFLNSVTNITLQKHACNDFINFLLLEYKLNYNCY